MLLPQRRGSTCEAYVSRASRCRVLLTRHYLALRLHLSQLGASVVVYEVLLGQHVLEVFLDFIQMDVLVFLQARAYLLSVL